MHWKTPGPNAWHCGSAPCSGTGGCAKAPASKALGAQPPLQKATAAFCTGTGRCVLVPTSSPEKRFHPTSKLRCLKPHLRVVLPSVRACQETESVVGGGVPRHTKANR